MGMSFIYLLLKTVDNLKKTRDQILQQHFNIELKIDNADIILLNHIPIRLLHKRKEYSFFIERKAENN